MSRKVKVETIHRVVSYATYTAEVDADKFEEYHGFPIEEAGMSDIEAWCENEQINLRLVSEEEEDGCPAAVFVDNYPTWVAEWVAECF